MPEHGRAGPRVRDHVWGGPPQAPSQAQGARPGLPVSASRPLGGRLNPNNMLGPGVGWGQR